mgnify:CR=1 FL=1
MARFGVNEMWWLAGGHAHRTVDIFRCRSEHSLPPGVCLSTLVLRVSSREEAEISGAADAEMSVSVCMSSSSPYFRKVKLYKISEFFSADF